MPISPYNNKCSQLGCKAPRSKINSFCISHGGMDNVETRESDSIYQTSAWRSIRGRQLSVQPLCQGCLSRGHIASGVHVDHVFPWKHIGKQAFTRNLFQSLCQPCHSTKTGQEKQGKYDHYSRDGVVTYTKHDYSAVMHRLHTAPQNLDVCC